MKWASHCSAFLLEEKYSLSVIDFEESCHPKLVMLRQAWLEFSKEHKVPVPVSRPAVMALSTAILWSMFHQFRQVIVR